MSERTLVGLPLYEDETQQGLEVTLDNIDTQLNELGIDSSVVVQVNGPETAEGRPPGFVIDQSRYNTEVEVVASERLGQTRALDDLVRTAAVRGIARAFMTDADIYRLPGAMTAMWDQAERPIVGARYRPYPVQVVEAEFGPLTPQERMLYQIFDGDQSPQVRQVLRDNDIDRNEWVKASLMLLEVDAVGNMHGNQGHISDSVMNRTMGAEKTQIADGAYFMHMGRVDMTDHIKARLRHFQGAVATGGLKDFLHKEIVLPSEAMMNSIAQQLRESTPNGDYYAMLYLTRCAVREKVNQVCYDIATGVWNTEKLGETYPISMGSIAVYGDAKKAISRFFLDVDWNAITGTATSPPPITQERLRQPFSLYPYLHDRRLAPAILDTLGVESYLK
jgi:hypothetical protein